jgi:hypothetical protein
VRVLRRRKLAIDSSELDWNLVGGKDLERPKSMWRLEQSPRLATISERMSFLLTSWRRPLLSGRDLWAGRHYGLSVQLGQVRHLQFNVH